MTKKKEDEERENVWAKLSPEQRAEFSAAVGVAKVSREGLSSHAYERALPYVAVVALREYAAIAWKDGGLDGR